MNGYIYVLSNVSMPGILKIGFTDRTPADRAAELSMDTGVPTAFAIEYWRMTSYANEVERNVHEKLSACRVNKSREFFTIDVAGAIAVIRECVQEPLVEYGSAPTQPQFDAFISPALRRALDKQKRPAFCLRSGDDIINNRYPTDRGHDSPDPVKPFITIEQGPPYTPRLQQTRWVSNRS